MKRFEVFIGGYSAGQDEKYLEQVIQNRPIKMQSQVQSILVLPLSWTPSLHPLRFTLQASRGTHLFCSGKRDGTGERIYAIAFVPSRSRNASFGVDLLHFVFYAVVIQYESIIIFVRLQNICYLWHDSSEFDR